MKQIKIKWQAISPADLCSATDISFFAFSKDNTLLHVGNTANKCLFTEVILAAAGFSTSMYEMDLWIGTVDSAITTGLNSSIKATHHRLTENVDHLYFAPPHCPVRENLKIINTGTDFFEPQMMVWRTEEFADLPRAIA